MSSMFLKRRARLGFVLTLEISTRLASRMIFLSHILVASTTGHAMLSFMDGFFGYNQILMAPEDREKTSFITEWGTYCYRVMSFGLKNAGATY